MSLTDKKKEKIQKSSLFCYDGVLSYYICPYKYTDTFSLQERKGILSFLMITQKLQLKAFFAISPLKGSFVERTLHILCCNGCLSIILRICILEKSGSMHKHGKEFWEENCIAVPGKRQEQISCCSAALKQRKTASIICIIFLYNTACSDNSPQNQDWRSAHGTVCTYILYLHLFPVRRDNVRFSFLTPVLRLLRFPYLRLT